MIFKRRKTEAGKPTNNPLASRVIRGDDRPTQPLEKESPDRSGPEGERHGSPTATQPVKSHGKGTERFADEPATRLVLPPDASDAPPFIRTVSGLPIAVLLVLHGPERGTLLPLYAQLSALSQGSDGQLRVDPADTQSATEPLALISADTECRRFEMQRAVDRAEAPQFAEAVTLSDGSRLQVGDHDVLFRILLHPPVPEPPLPSETGP